MANEIAPFHFFKIIVSESLNQGKLMIPVKFVNKYGEGLPTAIYLNTPNGAVWKINLVKNDGKIWFEKGWKEFEEYYSLSHGHLLVFKYEKTCHFEVQIFDKSALEINYPSKSVETEKVLSNEDDSKASQKKKINSSFEVGKEVNATLERATEFKTCNPSFVIVMRASYVEHHFCLSLPKNFGKRHFDLDKKKGIIYFQVLDDGRVWSARYSIRMSDKGSRFELSRGWRDFVKDNNLKVGDVCNFELILKTKMTFLVHIFRNTK
ncbi:unnamed protein product [Lathyrus oleraceus]|uniref:TF-B3 domain-containing protein n=1 Tax=Pisum sativum TaxID=3888 RepID=A0A9D4Y4E2_PEA|nr:hypothetical protein KIW84_034808 [Pisum sativum]